MPEWLFIAVTYSTLAGFRASVAGDEPHEKDTLFRACDGMPYNGYFCSGRQAEAEAEEKEDLLQFLHW